MSKSKIKTSKDQSAKMYSDMGFIRSTFDATDNEDIYNVDVPKETHFYSYRTDPPTEYFEDHPLTGPLDLTFKPTEFQCTCDIRLKDRHNVCINDNSLGQDGSSVGIFYCSSKCNVQIGRINKYKSPKVYRFLCVRNESDLENIPRFEYLIGNRVYNLGGISAYGTLYKKIILDLISMGYDGLMYREGHTLLPFLFESEDLILEDVIVNSIESKQALVSCIAFMKSGHDSDVYYQIKRELSKSIADKAYGSSTSCPSLLISPTLDPIPDKVSPHILKLAEELPTFLTDILNE